MRVYGHNVDRTEIDWIVNQLPDEFTFTQVEAALTRERRDMDRGVCMRAADRYLQKERKQGNLAFDRQKKLWVKLVK